MKLLQKKLKSKKGFTLIEMLVVIAIIAILVAISIPMVSGALEKAREAADDANLQAAKSVALLAEMEGITDGNYFYSIKDGVLKKSPNSPAADDAPQAGDNKGSGSPKNNAIVVTITDGKINGEVHWGKFGS